MKKSAKIGLAVVSCLYVFLCSCGSEASGDSDSKEKGITGNVTVSSAESVSEAETSATTETTAATEEVTATETEASEESVADTADESYEENSYYDIVDTATLTDSIGDTVIIHKVMAKQDVSLEATLIAYAEDGSVIDKTSDDITLTEGEYNYFSYYFESDVSNADIQAQIKASDYSFGEGDRDAVEMVQYNVSDGDLYVTFKQVSDNLGSFAKFKLLFYKGDEIVDAEYGYFDVDAENLCGKDTTDVAEIWVYDVDFDSVEYIFEP
jgi:hypothetical protein